MAEVVFWQTCISPHMQGLATSLADCGVSVTYVAGRVVSSDRAALGWSGAAMPGVRLIVLDNEAHDLAALVAGFPSAAVHLVQGTRRNGYLQEVIGLLRARRARWGAIMESVRDSGMRGVLKRLDYRLSLGFQRRAPDFVLAIGKNMPQWVARRGFPAKSIFPFTYFLPSAMADGLGAAPDRQGVFTVGFVGAIEERKRLDLLISAIVLTGDTRVHLSVIGSGPLSTPMAAEASRRLGSDRTTWYGALPLVEARRLMGQFDCLVLPSDHDGWGAVVSEALMNGVPAICSDACGAAEAIEASGEGGVFPRGDAIALSRMLVEQVRAGQPSLRQRERIAKWARTLGGHPGARYLIAIIGSQYGGQAKPIPPWRGIEVDSDHAQQLT